MGKWHYGCATSVPNGRCAGSTETTLCCCLSAADEVIWPNIFLDGDMGEHDTGY